MLGDAYLTEEVGLTGDNGISRVATVKIREDAGNAFSDDSI